ncbi:MAG: hypothetical protein HZB26_05360 [Candidatus Hydrogenedentes bacterium]|nr:hypothetical protein [Candidatus Hydrogenedentota bacterium]
MSECYKRTGARYGIDNRGLCSHAEANGLGEVLAALNWHVGEARVIDGRSQTVALAGTVDEVQNSISGLSPCQGVPAREAVEKR